MIRRMVAYDVDWLQGAPGRARFLFLSQQSQFSTDAQKQIKDNARVFFRSAKEHLARHVKNGQLRPLAVDMLLAIVFGPVTEWGRQWLAGSALSTPNHAKTTLAEAAWAGVRS